MKRAFTLAEVLITLTIIGVIAVLTIPNLMKSYDRHIHEAKIKKFFAEFSNNVTTVLKESGCDDIACALIENGINYNGRNDMFMRRKAINLFFKNTQYDGTYANPTGLKCVYSANDTYFINGTKNTNNCGWGGCMGAQGVGVCVDGNIGITQSDQSFSEMYKMNCRGTNATCANLLIFTDGKTQKPVIGKNVFVLYLRADGTIVAPTSRITKTQAQNSPINALHYLRQNNWQMDYLD